MVCVALRRNVQGRCILGRYHGSAIKQQPWLQGQQAQSLLGLMTSLPGIYQAPIQQQMQAAQGQAGGFTNLGGAYQPQQQSQIAPQIGQQIGAGLQGAGQGIAQGQQQQFQNSLLQQLIQQRGNSGLSNQSPQQNQFSQYQ